MLACSTGDFCFQGRPPSLLELERVSLRRGHKGLGCRSAPTGNTRASTPLPRTQQQRARVQRRASSRARTVAPLLAATVPRRRHSPPDASPTCDVPPRCGPLHAPPSGAQRPGGFDGGKTTPFGPRRHRRDGSNTMTATEAPPAPQAAHEAPAAVAAPAPVAPAPAPAPRLVAAGRPKPAARSAAPAKASGGPPVAALAAGAGVVLSALAAALLMKKGGKKGSAPAAKAAAPAAGAKAGASAAAPRAAAQRSSSSGAR